ncbi:MAG: IS1634 family transposase [Candidatus Marsarchaeota archaeon]|nr:IS1634 family transposase [Candidatus Marsarchaeota archaeon]
MEGQDSDLQITDARFLPIVSAYATRIGLVDQIDRLVACDMEVSPGRIVLALILDALSGRSPLFRLQEFFAGRDIELLLGEDIPLAKLADYTLGRVLERLCDVGTNKVLGAVVLGAMKSFSLDTSHAHHDTTSHTVYGDYLLYDWEGNDQPFVITNGFSKDHRPDLKQLVHSLLCVDHGIPVYSRLLDGNESDKNINRNLMPEMVKRMRELGSKDFIYVADAALITEANLALMDDWDNGFLFVSRLPMTYNECRDAISRAVEERAWEEIGVISDEPGTRNRKPAAYRAYETIVTLYGTNYRGLVVHSDAYDERRQKKVSKQIEQDRDCLAKMKKEVEKVDYACLPDAQAAAERIKAGLFHEIVVQVEPKPVYQRGRPKAREARTPTSMRYGLRIDFRLDEKAVERAREEAGCFVLITNTLAEGEGSVAAKELLTIYKDQHMVEQNFGFLKDPVFVNALFLKSPRRIEALGLVLVLALLIWRLMERTMRVNLAQNQQKITGWERRQTSRPTSFMMTTKFIGIFVLTSDLGRRLAKPLSPLQIQYLEILELAPDIFTRPPAKRKQKKKTNRKITQNSS